MFDWLSTTYETDVIFVTRINTFIIVDLLHLLNMISMGTTHWTL